MDTPVFHLGSFCSGVGWLDIAVKLALEQIGINSRLVFASEWDSYAAAVLKSRMEDSSLEPCPIFVGDLRDFPAEEFRGVVDGLAFGFPCQDISCAGRGEGINGSRSGLFFDILAAACLMGARYLFLENVSMLTVRGMDAVLGALAEAGFYAEWLCLPASAVGASHKRDRWFCVAVSTQRGQRELRESPRSDGQPDGCDETVGESSGTGPEGNGRCSSSSSTTGQRTSAAVERASGEFVGDTECTRRKASDRRQQHTRAQFTARSGFNVFAPGPASDEWRRLHEWPHLAPAVESGICLLADGCALVVDESRADQLRCSGNGVVILQGAVAFTSLLHRIGVRSWVDHDQ